MEKGCPNCGRMVDITLTNCPYCNYDFSDLSNVINKYGKEKLKTIEQPKYAGLIKRLAATSFDIIIWTSLALLISLSYIIYSNRGIDNINLLIENQNPEKLIPIIIIFAITPIFYLVYCIIRQYSKKMGTLGERIVGIEVVTIDDAPLELKDAIAHNLARILNIITLGLGYLLIIFTKRKQALSDIVSHTCVTNKLTNENYNNFRYPNQISRLIAFIIDIAFSALVIGLYLYVKTSPLIPDSEIKNTAMLILGATLIFYVIVYFPYMEHRFGATLGKRIMDIKVVGLNGEKPSTIRAVIRFILMPLDLLIIFSPLLALVTPRKQTLKDLITKTIVISTN